MPYLIKRLGSQGYGIYQLARSALVFFMFLQLGMGPTLVRFFSKAISKNDQNQIKSISSTAQLLLGGIGLFATFLFIVLIPLFLHFYNVPSGLAYETKWLLIFVGICLFFNISVIVPQGLIYGENHYDSANIIEILSNLMRLVLIVGFFEFFQPSILLLGLGVFLSQLFKFTSLFAIAYRYSGKAALFSKKYVTKKAMQSLFGFSTLNLSNSFAAAAVFQGPVLIIGKVLGENMVTAFAPAILISNAMKGFLGQTTRPLVPLASREREDNDGATLGKWAIIMGQIAAFVGFGIALPLSTFGHEIVYFWLGNNLTWIWPVVAILSTGVAISQVQTANYYLSLGGGDIKPIVYSQIVMAIIVLTGIWIGTVYFNWGLLKIAFYIGLCILIRNTFYLSFSYSFQFSFSYRQYLIIVYALPIMIMSFSFLFGFSLKSFIPPVNIAILFLETVLVLIFYTSLTWLILVPKPFKNKIVCIAISRITRKP